MVRNKKAKNMVMRLSGIEPMRLLETSAESDEPVHTIEAQKANISPNNIIVDC